MTPLFGVVVTVITVIGVITGIAYGALSQARLAAESREKQRQKSFDEGAKSRDPEVALLTSQRNDAWHDRDDAQERIRELEAELHRRYRGGR